MKRNSLWIILLGVAVCVSIGYFVYPNLKSEAQISEEKKKKEDDALLAIKSQPISNMLYELMNSEEKSKGMTWLATKGFSRNANLQVKDYPNLYFMEFTDDRTKVTVSIFKFDSIEEASSRVNNLKLQMGIIKAYKEFGEEGIKIVNEDNGKLESIKFRKGNFTISISCDSEEITKRFASYALKAIEGH
jgi:hypothetical protein